LQANPSTTCEQEGGNAVPIKLARQAKATRAIAIQCAR
jgi:hypothetical protein